MNLIRPLCIRVKYYFGKLYMKLTFWNPQIFLQFFKDFEINLRAKNKLPLKKIFGLFFKLQQVGICFGIVMYGKE